MHCTTEIKILNCNFSYEVRNKASFPDYYSLVSNMPAVYEVKVVMPQENGLLLMDLVKNVH